MKRLLAGALAGLLSIGTAVAAEAWQKLVTPAELATLDDVKIVDIRSTEAYGEGHLPGAFNMPYGKWRGPADNPGEIIGDWQLTDMLQQAGITPDDRLVITHSGDTQSDFGAAARVYWTLKSANFPTLAILNGGVDAWVAAGEPLTTEVPQVERSDATFVITDKYMIDRQGVKEIIAGKRTAALVDARPSAFFQGEKKHDAASRAGTLKGAQSLTFDSFFNGDSKAVGDAALARAEADGVESDGEIVSFCNTGHWAAINWFTMSELAGKKDVKLYPESMVGWLKNGGEAVKGN